MKLLSALLLAILCAPVAFACIPPPTLPTKAVTWAPGSTVAIMNDPVHPVPFADLQTAMSNWNSQLASLAPCSGVSFVDDVDISGTGHPIQLAWTAQGSHDAFLALPGTDGLVHNGTELFGNFTPQPQSAHPNGFLALAQFDKPENGGNSDGIIDERDAVFSRLRLWIDENHDGICQPNELHALPELGVFSLALNYREFRRTDAFGNQFRYRARVNPNPNYGESDVGRWVYDVFLTTVNR